jgi:SAM-dependent methyltransferase
VKFEPEKQDAAAVREFFDQWALYRKVVDHDYLFHGEAMKALSRWLAGRRMETFLDLGCGDASFTTGVLAGSGIRYYEGVDLSPVALELARQNAARLGCGCGFTCGDFSVEVSRIRGVFDVVYIGLSFHHLRRHQKEAFFGAVGGRLARGGAFVFFEPALRGGEGRDVYLEKWIALARRNWTALTDEEMAGVVSHVTGSDFPETVADYRALAAAAGLGRSEVLFEEEAGPYVVMTFERGK